MDPQNRSIYFGLWMRKYLGNPWMCRSEWTNDATGNFVCSVQISSDLSQTRMCLCDFHTIHIFISTVLSPKHVILLLTHKQTYIHANIPIYFSLIRMLIYIHAYAYIYICIHTHLTRIYPWEWSFHDSFLCVSRESFKICLIPAIFVSTCGSNKWSAQIICIHGS